jgi:hypothetical protein
MSIFWGTGGLRPPSDWRCWRRRSISYASYGKEGQRIITVSYYGVFYIGEGKPVFSEFTVCFAETEEMAKRIAYEYWPITANKGELNQELPTPTHFEQLAKMVSPEDVVKNMPTGPDPQRYIDEINKFIEAGADHICLHQIGPNQTEFIQFIKELVLPQFVE